jgi:chemotaxis protein CheD
MSPPELVGSEQNQRFRERIRVGISEFAVTSDDEILSTSCLGSCVGVVLYDADHGIAGLVHIKRPSVDGTMPENPGKFADTGISALLDAMEAQGADRSCIRAMIAGGGNILDIDYDDHSISQRNITQTREVLDTLGIPIVSQDVGGEIGRSLTFDSKTGELSIDTVSRTTTT